MTRALPTLKTLTHLNLYSKVKDILAAEKQTWVEKLKKENSILVGVLAEVRAAKKKLLNEYDTPPALPTLPRIYHHDQHHQHQSHHLIGTRCFT